MKDKQEKKDQEKFNSVTSKTKPENQNQHHNVRKEGVDAKRRQVEYSSAAKPPVRCGGSHLSGLTEPLVLHCHAWV